MATVTAILTRALTIADVVGSSVYSSAEQYASLNSAYRDLYERIIDADDDFYASDWSILLSAMTAVSGQSGAYTISLPTGFYRLRLLEYQVGTNWYPFQKFGLHSVSKVGGAPIYRIKGDKLLIMIPDGSSYTTFRAWFYPEPTTYTSGSETISFPPQIDTDIIAHQIAIDIKRKQNADYKQLQQRKDELFGRFMSGIMKRDDYSYQRVSNTYQSTVPWR